MDFEIIKKLNFPLKSGSVVYADKAYTDYDFEDHLALDGNIELLARRKKNSKRPHTAANDFLISIRRNKIETTFSTMTALMPKSIRAVTQRCFFLKVFLFILAFCFKQIIEECTR